MIRITVFLFVFLSCQSTFMGQTADTLKSVQPADTIHMPGALPPFSWPDTIHEVDFNRGVMTDPLQMILGKEPGAEVFKAGSDPCVPSSILIRGENGMVNEKSPLYVIDGVIGGDLFMVPPEEIVSFRILKDLSATSRYGSEGGRGVIIVTTKEPVKNKLLGIRFNTALSLGQVSRSMDLLTAGEMREQAAEHTDLDFIDGGATTDWQDEIFRSTVSQLYQLSFGGTYKNTSYRLSGSYNDQPGNVRGTDRNITGGIFSISQSAFRNKLKMNAMVSWYGSKNKMVSYPSERTQDNTFYQTYKYNPTDPVYTADGNSYYQGNREFSYNNPMALVTLIGFTEKNSRISAMLNTTWEIWKGLGVKLNGSYSGNEINSAYFRPEGAIPGSHDFSAEMTDKSSRYDLLAGLTYRGNLGKHSSLDLFAGYVLRSVSNETETSGNYNNGGDLQHSSLTQYQFDNCFLATLDYGFRNKYFLNIVINQEHNSSGLGKVIESDPAWGEWVFYPGITASWNIGREKFMQKAKWISDLILRAGYGRAGTRPDGVSIFVLQHQELQTEVTDEFTGAMEAGFFRNRILARIEFYYRNTGNAILIQGQPVPPNLNPVYLSNAMKISNSGIEVKLVTEPIRQKNMYWNSTLCFSMNENKVTLPDDARPVSTGYVDYYSTWSSSPYVLTTTSGHSLLAFNLPAFAEYLGHRPIYQTANGGYTNYPDAAVREITDDVFPANIFSWTNTFRIYKSFDLSMMFTYVAGHRIFNGTRMYLSIPENYLHVNTLPEAGSNYDNGYYYVPFGDLYLENASYLRLENLSFGYTFIPGQRNWTDGLKIYLAFGNLFTITDYSGSDPSFNYDSPGLDYFNTYPKTRTYTLGICLGI